MIPYCFVDNISELTISKSDIFYYRQRIQQIYKKLSFFMTEARVPKITTLSVGTDDSAEYIYKMNYENFVHTTAKLIRKYAPNLLN